MAKLTPQEQETKQRLRDAITSMEYSDAPRNWSTWNELHAQLSHLIAIERGEVEVQLEFDA